jgi:apolipoprotein N-acyltransferase
VVQADVRQESKYDADIFQSIVSRYLTLTASPPKLGRAPDIVIWPEGALPAPANDLFSPSLWTYAAIANALKPGQTLMIGAYRVDDGMAVKATYYNSLFALRREGEGLTPVGLYDKHRLVPFGEYMPLEPLMTAIGFKKMVHVGDGFTSGPPPRPMAAPGIPRVQPLICYESLFPGLVREGAALGGGRAEWIVNVSNDAWFGRTSGPLQHLNLASYRAIEEGIPVIRATPTGVSAVVDAYGRPKALLGLGKAGVIDANLPPALAPTLYSRWRDGPFWIFCLGGAIVAAWGRIKQPLRRRYRA